jgi:lipid-A-disaccharide synthase
VPMVVAYRVSKIEEVLKYLIKAPSIVLTNLVLGENVIPELIQWDCTPDKLADALLPLLKDSPERQRQVAAFGKLDDLMRIGDEAPSERAARIVEEVLVSRRA